MTAAVVDATSCGTSAISCAAQNEAPSIAIALTVVPAADQRPTARSATGDKLAGEPTVTSRTIVGHFGAGTAARSIASAPLTSSG
ncbi:MAG: hypothetical protein IPF60_17195 [Betaproteobacteria bacterium]|nr:hypothetical protein [Betaproteobacteria bacterium]